MSIAHSAPSQIANKSASSSKSCAFWSRDGHWAWEGVGMARCATERGATIVITGRAGRVCPVKGSMESRTESRTESRVALVILHLQKLVCVISYTCHYTDRLLPCSYHYITALFHYR